MREFFKDWKRTVGTVTLGMACSAGCMHPVRTATTATARPVGYQIEFKKSGATQGEANGRRIEYRLDGDVMLVVANGELRINGNAVSPIEESDLVTVEDSRNVLLNGVEICRPE